MEVVKVYGLMGCRYKSKSNSLIAELFFGFEKTDFPAP